MAKLGGFCSLLILAAFHNIVDLFHHIRELVTALSTGDIKDESWCALFTEKLKTTLTSFSTVYETHIKSAFSVEQQESSTLSKKRKFSILQNSALNYMAIWLKVKEEAGIQEVANHFQGNRRSERTVVHKIMGIEFPKQVPKASKTQGEQQHEFLLLDLFDMGTYIRRLNRPLNRSYLLPVKLLTEPVTSTTVTTTQTSTGTSSGAQNNLDDLESEISGISEMSDDAADDMLTDLCESLNSRNDSNNTAASVTTAVANEANVVHEESPLHPYESTFDSPSHQSPQQRTTDYGNVIPVLSDIIKEKVENSPSAPVEDENDGATREDAKEVQGLLLWSPIPLELNSREPLRRACQTKQLANGLSYNDSHVRIFGGVEDDPNGTLPPFVSVGELFFDGEIYRDVTLIASATYNDPISKPIDEPAAVCTAKFKKANGKNEGVDFTEEDVRGMLQRREMRFLKCPNGDDAGMFDIMSLNDRRHTYLMRERDQGIRVVHDRELRNIYSPSQTVPQRDDDESDAGDYERDVFSDSDEMCAETASSSDGCTDVESVENGTAVQQNFTPTVSTSALFERFVEGKESEWETFVIETKRKEVFKMCGRPWKNARFSNPETTQAKLLAIEPQRNPKKTLNFPS